MAENREIDELNILSQKDSYRSTPYEQYFGEMSLSKEEKERRIELAKQLEAVFLATFILIYKKNYTNNQALDYLQRKYEDTMSNFSGIDKKLKSYIRSISQDIIDTTVKNIDSDYYTSCDRAMFIAENEANSTMNYLQFEEAVKSGRKNKKWVDIRDNRERKSHLEIGGTVIPIKEPFRIGNSLMMYPKDSSLGADAGEIVNCRCSVMYL